MKNLAINCYLTFHIYTKHKFLPAANEGAGKVMLSMASATVILSTRKLGRGECLWFHVHFKGWLFLGDMGGYLWSYVLSRLYVQG